MRTGESARKPSADLNAATASRPTILVLEDRIHGRDHLRDDVRFHDGRPFTSEDVRATLEARDDDRLEHVDTPDPSTAVLHFRAPAANLLYDLASIPMMPADAAADFGNRPIGTGPFAFAGLYDAAFRAQFLSGLIMPISMFIGNLSYAVVAVVGGLRVASGRITLGDVQAFIQYSRQFTQPVTQIASMINLLQSGVASAERVFELLDADEESAEPVAELARPATEARGRVTFEHVAFRYEDDQPLIDDLSLVAAPGQTVAIVGPTGAGKTTLVNLLMRFYELDGGHITLDGVDIAAMARGALRSQIGMVLQDTWLFKGTIRDNIAYGRPDASDEEVQAAARATFVDRFVHSLPEGYDTEIDDEGGNVSAGEKQLITIARAFLADPALLILDEATSSVDSRTELLVQQAMAALRGDRTSFVIAHRLSTIVDADLILVMELGRIVERGAHAELLTAGGAYAELHRTQFVGEAVYAAA
ncbi:MAG: ATP-binding cassette domain-containing protein [Trueperaceae bacterium]|nr:ATP-binding cassette domain-containing protein [Trueperaceae bacterium]